MTFWQFATGYLLAGIAFGSLIMARLGKLSRSSVQQTSTNHTLLDAAAFFALLQILWPISLGGLILVELAYWAIGGEGE